MVFKEVKDSWAKREVELACKHENPDWDGKSFDYGCACYQSALKAYESLMGDGHSGTSFGFTKNILVRLMEGLPLTPITEKDFNDAVPCNADNRNVISKKCPRMSGLFRNEYPDGKVVYTDINRAYCIDINNPSNTYSYGYAIRIIIDEMFPITMPYYPPIEKYKVYVEDFLTDRKNSDFDTRAFLYCITPEGERVEINRFYAYDDDTKGEISREEYEERKSRKL